jgi:hypothetical protein
VYSEIALLGLGLETLTSLCIHRKESLRANGCRTVLSSLQSAPCESLVWLSVLVAAVHSVPLCATRDTGDTAFPDNLKGSEAAAPALGLPVFDSCVKLLPTRDDLSFSSPLFSGIKRMLHLQGAGDSHL